MKSCKTGFLALIILFAFSGCKWQEPPPKDTLVMGLGSMPKTLDPRFATDAYGTRIGSLLFSSLVKVGDDLKAQPDAAESWTYHNLVYDFKLKPNIRFHNGDLLTKEDILFSFEEFSKPSSPFAFIMNLVTKVEATYSQEGGHVKIYLKKFSAPFLTDLQQIKLLSKKLTTAAGDDFYANPVGTGVFQWDREAPNNIFIKRFPDYFGEVAKSEKVQFKVIKDSNTRFQKVYKGKIDIVQNDVPHAKVRIFDNSEKFNVFVAPGLTTKYVLFNLKDPVFGQLKVRKAIQSVLNVQDLIKYSMEGFADPATAVISSLSPFFNKNLQKNPLSKEEIQRVFDGLKGKKIVLKTSNDMSAIEHGKIISHQLRAAGLDLEQQSYEWGTYYEDVRTGKFQMAIMKWVGIVDPDIYRFSLHSELTPPGRNRGYYSNRRFDKLVESGLVEPEFEKRKKLYDEAQKIVFNEVPTIPLWYEKQIAIVHKRVKGYQLPANGDFSPLTKAYK